MSPRSIKTTMSISLKPTYKHPPRKSFWPTPNLDDTQLFQSKPKYRFSKHNNQVKEITVNLNCSMNSLTIIQFTKCYSFFRKSIMCKTKINLSTKLTQGNKYQIRQNTHTHTHTHTHPRR